MIKQIQRKKYLLTGIMLMAALAGCSGGADEDLNRYIQKVKARPPKPIPPMPEIKPIPVYAYPENNAERSPFLPAGKGSGAAPDKNRQRDPLEAFPLDALKFVGTLQRGSISWALIQEPGGKISYIQPGQYMGKHFGKVLKISDDKISLQETVNIGGKWEKKVTHLELYKRK